MRMIITELYKLFHRKEFYISIGILASFSLLFAILIGTDSNVMEISGGGISGAMFTAFVVQFISGFLGMAIFVGITVASIWSGEISDGTIATMILKAKNRRELFLGKLLATYLSGIIYVASTIICSSLFYILIGRYGSKYNPNYFDVVENDYISFIYITLLFVLFSTSLITLLSMKFSQMKALLAMLGILILTKILEKVDSIKTILPTYITDVQRIFTDSMDSKTILFTTMIIVVYISILNLGSYTIFKRMDVK